MPKLLLVDDDELLRELLQMQIEVEGYDVAVAENGAEAIDLLRRERCDAVVLDLMMPVMDGMRFMRTLAQEVPDPPPVLVLSAVDSPEVRRDLAAVGVRDVVRKPVDLPDRLARIAAVAGAA